MSQIKREVERQDQMRNVAIDIAKETGLLEECEAHGYTLSTGETDATSAYKYANALYSKKDTRIEVFKNRNELTDTIKDVVQGHGMTCPGCEKIERE